ncbi:MAG TPA: hypothetical protein ENK38_03960 [Gammaproteobacteria bacterium]|nr:hypothetical protein [Gammaproteobacteria bacterium]
MKTIVATGTEQTDNRRIWTGRARDVTILLLLLLFPLIGAASGVSQQPPHWSLEFKGGSFFPKEDDWKAYYGDDKTGQLSGAIAYKLTRQFEVGIDGSYIKDEGKGLAPQQDQVTGNVTLELYPLQLFALVRGVFSENQWLVPYLGAGWTRVYYEQDIRGQEKRRGAATGTHIRAGLQLLLDNIDRSTAWGFYESFGVNNSYFFLEMQRSSVEIGSNPVELGGTSYQVGLLFEF